MAGSAAMVELEAWAEGRVLGGQDSRSTDIHYPYKIRPPHPRLGLSPAEVATAAAAMAAQDHTQGLRPRYGLQGMQVGTVVSICTGLVST